MTMKKIHSQGLKKDCPKLVQNTLKNTHTHTKIMKATIHFFKHNGKTKVHVKGLDLWP